MAFSFRISGAVKSMAAVVRHLDSASLGTRVQHVIARLKQSLFARNVASVGLGIAAAQAISLAFSPFLTRLYGPEAFGVLAAYTAVINIAMPMATLGYASAIVMPDDDERASAVARLAFICAAIVSMVALLLIHVFKPQLAIWIGMDATPGFLYLIPPSLLLSALFSVADQAAIRGGLFKPKAQAHVGSTVLINTAKLTGGFITPSGLLLVLVEAVGKAIRTVMLLILVPMQGALRPRNWLGIRGIKQAMWDHSDFALYRMPQSMINAGALGLPVILLTTFFGSEFAGQYSLAMLVLGAPVVLLGQSVSEVFYPKITRSLSNNPEESFRQITHVTFVLASISIVPFGLLVALGHKIFPLLFGTEWVLAGEYAQWMAVWLYTTLTSRGCIAAYPALKLQRYLLFQEVISITLRVASLYIGYRVFESDVVAIALFSLSGVVIMLVLMAIAFVATYKIGKHSK